MRQDQFSPIGNLKLYFNKKYINEELLIHIFYSRSNWLGFKYILLILKEINGYENCPKIIVSFQSQKRWWTGWVISWNVTNFSLFVSKHNNSQFPHCERRQSSATVLDWSHRPRTSSSPTRPYSVATFPPASEASKSRAHSEL